MSWQLETGSWNALGEWDDSPAAPDSPDAPATEQPRDDASGLYALIPNVITPARLITSPVPMPDPAKMTPDGVTGEVEWVSGSTVAQNARRIRSSTRRIYRDTQGGAAGTTPPENNPIRWFDEGPVNQWAWADALASTATTAACPAVWTIDPGAATAVELFGLVNVDTVRLQVYDAPGGTLVYDNTLDTELYTDVDPQWQLDFEPPGQGRSVSFLGLDIGPDARCVVTVSSYDGQPVGVGLLAFGSYIYLGAAQFGFELSWTNYSRTNVDDYGNEVYVKGLKSKNLRGDAYLTLPEAGAVADAFESLQDVGAIYSVTTLTEYRHLTTWGRLRPATIVAAGPSHAIVSIEIQGKI